MIDKITINKQKKDKIQTVAKSWYPLDWQLSQRSAFINGAIFYKENISNSIEQVIKDICKDNTHLLDTPEIQEIIKYFKK